MATKSGSRNAWLTMAAIGLQIVIILVAVTLENRPTDGAASAISETVTPTAVADAGTTPSTQPGSTVTDGADPAATAATKKSGNGMIDRVVVVAANATRPPLRDCKISTTLALDAVGPEVECLEASLASEGSFAEVPDTIFDADTEESVRAFQETSGLLVDGVAGPQTISRLGVWITPEPDPATCSSAGRSAVIDRQLQRTWLCEDGAIVRTMPMTSSSAQPDRGSYRVTEKEMNATSEFSGEFSSMTHFVIFTTGKFSDARIGFHSVPVYRDGSLAQPLESVGELRLIGESSGCIRTVPDDAAAIWDFLAIDDPVIVIS